MRQNRKGESTQGAVRSDRFFSVGSEWYFATREGASIGPFGDKGEAEKGLQDFVDFLTLAEPELVSSFVSTLR